jgi:hypothetical protein
MIDTDVCLGSGRAERDGRVACEVPESVMVGVVGLMGVTGREWVVYQTNTAANC